MLLYFGKLWDIVCWVLTFLVLCTLSNVHPARQFPRLFLCSKGNKTLTSGPLYASCLLGAFVIFMHVYYTVGQTFVTRCDYTCNVISLCFVSLQFLLSVGQVLDFSRSTR